jgi:hypothetical protein
MVRGGERAGVCEKAGWWLRRGWSSICGVYRGWVSNRVLYPSLPVDRVPDVLPLPFCLLDADAGAQHFTSTFLHILIRFRLCLYCFALLGPHLHHVSLLHH